MNAHGDSVPTNTNGEGLVNSLPTTYSNIQDTNKSDSTSNCVEYQSPKGPSRQRRKKQKVCYEITKPHVCSVCNASFKHSSSLKTHEATHIVRKAFTCEDCGLTFAYKGNLKKHQLTHTGERPYMCSYCGIHFTQSSAMKTHARIHTGEKPYQCNTCDKVFRNKGNLSKHERTHTGLKPFTCTDCNKSFTQSSTLKIHRRIHTGERPYSCNDCDASFTSKGSLEHHKRKSCFEKNVIERVGETEPPSMVTRRQERIDTCDCYYPMNLADGMLAAQQKVVENATTLCPIPSSTCAPICYTSAFAAVEPNYNVGKVIKIEIG